MDIEKNIIFIKGQDKTKQIEFCEYRSGTYYVHFDINKNPYTYNCSNLMWLKNATQIDVEGAIIFIDNLPISNVAKAISFGNYIRIIYENGYDKVYSNKNVIIEKSCLSNNKANSCFEYLKKLSNVVSLKNEEDSSFLSKQYERLIKVSPRSALSIYLEQKSLNSSNKTFNPIFPFGLNLSQKSATEKALSERISIIEGPPGTGKTQTILNIIANAIIQDKTVAVVSNNNSATANVLEKLQKYDTDFIAAFLGNNDNKKQFFESQNGTYPFMDEWILENSEYQAIKAGLIKSQQELNEMLAVQNKLANLKQMLANLNVEIKYFEGYCKENVIDNIKLRTFLKFGSGRILSYLIDYQQKIEKGEISLRTKLYYMIAYKIYDFRFYKNVPESIISYFQKLYYDQKSKELNDEISALTKKLDNYNFDYAMKEYSQNSMKLFKSKLAARYKSRERKVFSSDALWKNFDSFIEEYPVILSTTHSLRNCTRENYLFDYIIIDESSQVDLVSGALALSCAQNAIIVGDVKQLPNVVSSEIQAITEDIFRTFDLDKAYNYAENSLLSSMSDIFKDLPRTLLREHYRCHPKIIEFCNQKFYNGELVILTNDMVEDKPLIVYKTAKGNHARGNYNQRQIDVIFNEIIPEQSIDENVTSVGIISPYRLQTNKLKEAIGHGNIEADTVHKFQGREKDIIIISTVANEINDFIDNPNLINVAVSRAVKQLIVVVSDDSGETKGTNIGDLVRYIKYNNFEVIESKIYSVFDLLYSSYSVKLLEIMRRYKAISKYKSENLLNTVIEKIINSPEFQDLDRIIHQPLKMLIKDTTLLDEDEYKYVMNILTHTDFVIFNKLGKIPVLVVELDGYAYHTDNPIQLKRDRMKDTILKKYDIPIIRINTNSSGEEEKIKQKLFEILNSKL